MKPDGSYSGRTDAECHEGETMKRRVIATALIVVVLIIAAALILPYFVGGPAEADFKAEVARINARHTGFAIEVDSYHRGFYSSEATLSLAPRTSLTPRAMRVWALLLGSRRTPEFKMRINHGPIALGAFGQGHVNFMPVLYTVEFRGDKLPPASLLGIFKPQLYSTAYFDGARSTTVTVPPGRYSMGVFGLTWRGMHVRVHANGALTRWQYSVDVAPVHYQAEDVQNGNSYSGEIKGVNFSGKRHQGPQKFWLGTGRSEFMGAEFKRNGKRVALLKPGHGRSSTTASGHGRWLESKAEFTLDGGEIKGWPFSQLHAREKISHVDAAALRRATDQLRANASGAPASRARLGGMVSSVLEGMDGARGKVVIALKSPAGRFRVHATASLSGAAPAAATAVPASDAVLDRLVARANLDFDRKIVDAFANQVLGGSQAQQTVDQVMDEWLHEGLLQTAKGGQYHSHIEYGGGILKVNGKVIYDASLKAPPAGTAAGGR